MGIRYYILGIFLSLFVANLYAMRCNDKLVYEGDTKYAVLAKCGEPLDKQYYEQSVPVFNQAGYQIGVSTQAVEAWIYQRSSADFQYELIFDFGVLKKINVNRNP